MCNLQDFAHLQLDAHHAQILKDELEMWHKNYLPCGKVVLDIGAGNGETAQFYLNHGAETVIAVEPDAKLLDENFVNDERVIINPFAVDHIKIDIEGAELGMIVETHNSYKFKKIYSFPSNRSIWKTIRVRFGVRKRLQFLWRLERR